MTQQFWWRVGRVAGFLCWGVLVMLIAVMLLGALAKLAEWLMAP